MLTKLKDYYGTGAPRTSSWHTGTPLNGRKGGLVAAAVEVQRFQEEPADHDRPESINHVKKSAMVKILINYTPGTLAILGFIRHQTFPMRKLQQELPLPLCVSPKSQC